MTPRANGVWSGVACGIAAGFVAWALLVRLDVPFHYGTSDAQSDTVRLACIAAGRLWLVCTFVGIVAGAALGLGVRAGGLVARAPIAMIATYLFALRGVWGYHGALPGGGGSMPAAAAVVLVLLALAGGSAIARRAPREATVRATIVPLHLCLSMIALHFTVQLPYYRALVPSFIAGLGDLVAIVLRTP